MVMLLVWVALTLALIGSRAIYDRHRRNMRAAVAAFRPRFQLHPDLDSLPRKVIEAVAADSRTNLRQAEVFARYAITKWDPAELISAAAGRNRRSGKWMRIEALRILVLGNHLSARPLLERAVDARDRDVTGAAVALLAYKDDKWSARQLVRALKDGAYPRSRTAAQVERLTVSTKSLLLPLLRDKEPPVRFWAATLLERYAGSHDVNRVLSRAAKDSDPNVRKAAVETLGRSGGPYAAETALARLADPFWYVRAHAARAIGDLRRGDLSYAVSPLLADQEWWVRTAAKDALQKLGTAAVPAVTSMLESPDRFARNGAAEVLQNLGVLDEALQAARGNPHAAGDLDMIRRIITAGGISFAQAALGRSAPEIRDDMIRVFKQAGVEAA